ncbi:MFS transporter [Microbispora sp. NPDC049125]|uniref:MFS transporter n=1 Tax=Microbispora sp. NPDC049125 TaxID=3154929 RepID=UPI0034677299
MTISKETHVPESTGANPLRWKALSILALVQFIIYVDATIVNVALPSIREDLGFTSDGLIWVVNCYLIAAGGLLLLGGRLADRIGRRRVFCVGSAAFAVASLVAGLAISPGMLLTGRVIQGVAEALAAPAGLAMVALLFNDPKERAKAFGMWAGLSGLGACAGVLLSGVFTGLLTWRLIFLINIPLSVIPLLTLPKIVEESRAPSSGRRIDWAGAALITGGLFMVIYGLLAAVHQSWSAPGVWGPLVGGLVALALALVVEANVAEPLIPLRFFRNRIRLTANGVTAIIGGVSAAVFFMVVLYVQDVLGYTPLQSGLAWVPFCLAFMGGLFGSMQIIMRFGPRPAMSLGLLVAAAGLYLLSQLPVGGSFWTQLLPATVLVAIGFGMTNPAMQQSSMHGVSEMDAGLGSGVLTTLLQLSGALGLAVFVPVALREQSASVAGGATAAQAAVSGFTLAFQVASIVLVIGSAAVLFLLRGTPSPAQAQHAG